MYVAFWLGVVGGPCDFSVSQRSKSFFLLFWGTFIQLGGQLGQGLGPGLDNSYILKFNALVSIHVWMLMNTPVMEAPWTFCPKVRELQRGTISV